MSNAMFCMNVEINKIITNNNLQNMHINLKID